MSSEKVDRKSIEALQEEIRQVYTADSRPWVIGFSGGKDSTTALQLTWYALAKLPPDQRKKPVFVIASDTLVETPVVVDQLNNTLDKISKAAEKAGMPFTAHKVQPELKDTFWVNMIGRGYPAPYRRFRWCTERLKILPANKFIEEKVNKYGEVIMVLGVRRAESATRAQVLSLHRKSGELLSRHSVLKSAWVYAPIEFFETQDVWTYLLAVPNPWAGSNRDLVTMYRNAQAGECPLVVDKTTPSCGNSRFGCWTCTVVERDKSMEAMVEGGQEWLEPLLELRDWLTSMQDPAKKHEVREVRRRSGRIQTWGEDDNKKIVWGPYKFEVRKEILKRLLVAQERVRSTGPDPRIELIQQRELNEIRRLWTTEEGDWLDSLPAIFREATGRDVDWVKDDTAIQSLIDEATLQSVCREHSVPAGLVKELIDIERSLQGLGRRSSVFDSIDRILGKDWRSAEEVFREINYRPDLEAEAEEMGASDEA
ncbi:MAG: DNA phosphorothioation system sulfurtransferase DndC [Myxococcales bacterium]